MRHKHLLVNDRTVDVPSFLVSANDEIKVREKSRNLNAIQESLEQRGGRNLPEWLEVNAENMIGRIRMNPDRGDIQVPVQEQLIVELYSK